jgi:hypothetical protein
MDAKFLIDFASSESKILQIFEVLELGRRHAPLEVSVSELAALRRVVPAEHRADNDEGLLLRAQGLVEGLSQNFDNGFCLGGIRARHQVHNDDVGGEDAFREGLGLGEHFELSDGGFTGRGHDAFIFLNESAKELVGFFLSSTLDNHIIVAHLLEKLVA